MAAGVRRLAGSTHGLATSGIAGPAGGSMKNPSVTVCIGLSTPGREFGYRFHFAYGRRSMNKQMFAMKAMDVLRRELLGCRTFHRSIAEFRLNKSRQTISRDNLPLRLLRIRSRLFDAFAFFYLRGPAISPQTVP